jgi:hypothetical protein
MNTGIPVANFEIKYVIFPNGSLLNKKDNTWKQPSKNPNGYFKYLLALNGKREQHLIHQLVARHFLPNPYKHIQVNHIDGDKAHNNIGNLEWISGSDNIQHSLKIGLRKGYMALDEKEKYIQEVLAGATVAHIAERIGRCPSVLAKMLKHASIKLNMETIWIDIMKIRRKESAIRNLPNNR